jgi:pSer/pThr/pTyr-binding forkhead associated (FHA) protein
MSPGLILLIFRVLLAVVLYAFLAALFLFLWRDVRAASRASTQIPHAQLLVVEGPEPGRCFPLVEVNSLGRAAGNHIRLADTTVSAYHARLSFLSRQWTLEDLGSKNGTRVNEITVEQPIVVTYGDQIQLGKVRLRLEASAVAAGAGDEAEKG